MNLLDLPLELKSHIGSEKVDFSVKAKRRYPSDLGLILFSTSAFFLMMVSLIVFIFFGKLFMNGKIEFNQGGETIVGSWQNPEPLIVPGSVIILFTIPCILFFVYACKLFFGEGGHFVGTEKRLIGYRQGKLVSTEWKGLSKNIEVKVKREMGEIMLEHRYGYRVLNNRNRWETRTDKIFIAGIPEVLKIEKMCRKRIEENWTETP
jgi:hypothetical protein